MTEIGGFYFPTEYGMQPMQLAKALEERGLDSLFFTEHIHIPASRRTPHRGRIVHLCFPGYLDIPAICSRTAQTEAVSCLAKPCANPAL